MTYRSSPVTGKPDRYRVRWISSGRALVVPFLSTCHSPVETELPFRSVCISSIMLTLHKGKLHLPSMLGHGTCTFSSIHQCCSRHQVVGVSSIWGPCPKVAITVCFWLIMRTPLRKCHRTEHRPMCRDDDVRAKVCQQAFQQTINEHCYILCFQAVPENTDASSDV